MKKQCACSDVKTICKYSHMRIQVQPESIVYELASDVLVVSSNFSSLAIAVYVPSVTEMIGQRLLVWKPLV